MDLLLERRRTGRYLRALFLIVPGTREIGLLIGVSGHESVGTHLGCLEGNAGPGSVVQRLCQPLATSIE